MNVTKRLFSRNKQAIDMTEGAIIPLLVSFAFPFFLGTLFQQLYNTVDAWVVGNFVSNEAFSAVGTVTPVTSLIIGFFTGFSGGTGIVISQMFGAKRYDDVEKAVHTAISVTLISCVVFTVSGALLSPFLLKMMNTPDSVFDEANTYLSVYFFGISGLLIYNIGAGILRAVGDSRRPFFFLIISALVNIVLDLLFVLVFNMGVIGVALATVLAQAVSAALVAILLMRTDLCVKLDLRKLRIHSRCLKKILSVGLPTAIQTSIVSLGGIFTKSYINAFGEDFMSGVTVYSKVESVVLLPSSAIAVASSTFVGQNLGAKNTPRAKKGIATSILLSFSALILMMIPAIIFSPEIVAFFNKKPEVVEYGAQVIRVIVPFFFFANFNTVIAGALRGAGKSIYPSVIVIATYVFVRQLYLFIMANFISNTPLPIVFSYCVGWIVASVIFLVCFFKTKLESTLV